MAEETVTAEPTLEAELEAFLGTTKSAAPAAAVVEDGTKPKPDAKAPPVASPEGSNKPAEADPLLAALEAIEEESVPDETPAGDKSGITADQKAVLDAIPSIEVATKIYEVAQNYSNFTDALAKGRFTDVESMLEQWNPEVLDNWYEHIYQKKIASGEWLDRYLDETAGKGKSKDLVKLEREVKTLKQSLDTKNETETKTTAEQSRQQNLTKFQTHVEGLFDQLNFSKPDRRWIIADLKIQIAGNPKVLAAIQAGNPKAVNPLFKAAIREYATRDKEIADTKGEKIGAQEKKKPLLGGAGGGAEDAIPDDIHQVKKGDEDKWLDKTLSSFLGKFKK